MIKFDDISELADVIDSICFEDGFNVHVIAKYDLIKELFNHLIVFNEYEADSVIMPSPYDTDYNKELMITIYDGGIITVTTIYDEDGYYDLCKSDSCVTYISNDCDKKLLNKCTDDCAIFAVKDSENHEDTEIKTSDDGHTISQTYVSEDGSSRYFKSFYSDDLSLVKSMLDTWK